MFSVPAAETGHQVGRGTYENIAVRLTENCQRRVSEAVRFKVLYLEILECKGVHFFESKHGSAAIFASVVS